MMAVGTSQTKSVNGEKSYKINFKAETSFTLALFAANAIGLNLLKNKTPLTSDQINLLDINDVWKFDRRAVEQSFSVDVRKNYWQISEWGMNVSIFLPALFIFDRKIKEDLLDIVLLYFEAQAIQSGFYTYGGVLFTNRIRPYVYYPDVSLESKYRTGAKDSFFSGHTSTVATTSFFMAQIYNNAHPELGRKKWLIYGTALLPPFLVGYSRYRALMHFPTDVLTGMTIGALVGVMVPNLHKLDEGNNQRIYISPNVSDFLGLSILIKI